MFSTGRGPRGLWWPMPLSTETEAGDFTSGGPSTRHQAIRRRRATLAIFVPAVRSDRACAERLSTPATRAAGERLLLSRVCSLLRVYCPASLRARTAALRSRSLDRAVRDALAKHSRLAVKPREHSARPLLLLTGVPHVCAVEASPEPSSAARHDVLVWRGAIGRRHPWARGGRVRRGLLFAAACYITLRPA